MFSFPFQFYLFNNTNMEIHHVKHLESSDSCLPLGPQSVSQVNVIRKVILLIFCCKASLHGAAKLQTSKHEGLQCPEMMLSELLLALTSAFSAGEVSERSTEGPTDRHPMKMCVLYQSVSYGRS